ncbi:MAG TPA: hypothetical protein VFP68_23065 [Burkholderiaceae bacterium]|nr:hypothetical protein [Burkholderiaceae bacterium]
MKFEETILPKMKSREIKSLRAAALELGRTANYFSNNKSRSAISFKDRSFDKDYPLFAMMTDKGRASLQELLDSAPESSKESGSMAKSLAASGITQADSVNFERNILPKMKTGEIKSLREAATALGKHKNLFTKKRTSNDERPISIEDRKFDRTYPLFSWMTDEGRGELQEYINSIDEQVKNSGYKTYQLWSTAQIGKRKSRAESQQPEASSSPRGPYVIDTPGVSFNDVYGGGIESEARRSSPATGEQPRGLQTYGPSPSFFDEVSSTGDAGSSSETAVHPSHRDSSTTGVPRQRHPGFERVHHPDRVDALPRMGGMSVAATQQSGPPTLERLDDRDLGILLEAVSLPHGTIRSVEDAALWLDDRGQGERMLERVRPYVSVIGDGDSAQIQLTEFGRREAEERTQRE